MTGLKRHNACKSMTVADAYLGDDISLKQETSNMLAYLLDLVYKNLIPRQINMNQQRVLSRYLNDICFNSIKS